MNIKIKLLKEIGMESFIKNLWRYTQDEELLSIYKYFEQPTYDDFYNKYSKINFSDDYGVIFEGDKAIGDLGYWKLQDGSLSLSVALDKDYWGKGIAQQAFAKYFDLIDLPKGTYLKWSCDVSNKPSNNLALNLGFTFKENGERKFNNEVIELNIYEMFYKVNK